MNFVQYRRSYAEYFNIRRELHQVAFADKQHTGLIPFDRSAYSAEDKLVAAFYRLYKFFRNQFGDILAGKTYQHKAFPVQAFPHQFTIFCGLNYRTFFQKPEGHFLAYGAEICQHFQPFCAALVY
ncbi:MAG: hypothetical protein AMXMBFR85_10850 [Dehalococcoides mccartyi]